MTAQSAPSAPPEQRLCTAAPDGAPATEARAGAWVNNLFARPCDAPQPLPEPRPPGPDIFQSVALPVSATALDSRWHHVSAAPVDIPNRAWAAASARAGTQHGLDRLQTINNWVNAHVAYAEDGRVDHWADLSETIARGRGDCEDFAIAKLQMLERAGVPADTLYLVIVADTLRHVDHAVLVAHEGGAFLVLDNRTDRILPTGEVADYRPVLSFASHFAWMHGYRAAAGHLASAGAATKIMPAGQSYRAESYQAAPYRVGPSAAR